MVPESAQWAAIGVTALGAFGVVRRRRTVLDAASWAIFAIGAVACLGLVGVAMVAPVPPNYTLSLRVGTSRATPVQVTTCATEPDGSATSTPDGGHVLAVIVDGVQVATAYSSRFLVPASPGTHTLRVELLNSDHREFNPEVAAETTISVSGAGPLEAWMTCPGQ